MFVQPWDQLEPWFHCLGAFFWRLFLSCLLKIKNLDPSIAFQDASKASPGANLLGSLWPLRAFYRLVWELLGQGGGWSRLICLLFQCIAFPSKYLALSCLWMETDLAIPNKQFLRYTNALQPDGSDFSSNKGQPKIVEGLLAFSPFSRWSRILTWQSGEC